MAGTSITMPEDLLAQVEESARTQNREPEVLVAEAVRKYLKDRKWRAFLTALPAGRKPRA